MTRTCLLPSLLLLAAPAWARTPGPPQPGTLSYVEGEVRIGPRAVSRAQEEQLAPGQRLETRQGRAELLLMPGAYLRVDQHSRIRLEQASLSDVRLVLEQGSAIVDVLRPVPDSGLEAVAGNRTVRIHRKGLYRLDALSSTLTVYKGLATLCCEGPRVEVTGNHRLLLASSTQVTRVPGRPGDSFDRWSRIREQQLSRMRSVAMARLYPGWYYDPFWGPYPYWWGPSYVSLWRVHRW